MSVYTPTITIASTPAIEITAAGLTYDELIASFGNYNYLIRCLFIQALSIDQTLQELTFQTYDSNGQMYIRTVSPPVSPYQYQPSLMMDVREQCIMINGRTSLSFNLLPLETLSLMIYAARDYVGEYLERFGIPNKMQVQI